MLKKNWRRTKLLRTVNMSTKKMAQKEEYKNVKYKMILNNSHVRIIPTQNLKINKFITHFLYTYSPFTVSYF